MSTLLEATGLQVRFGAVEALKGVDLSLDAGTVTGLIGPNGAGKTTLVDALTGYVPLHAGAVTIDGAAVTALPPHRRAASGVARTFQSLELFDDLTVGENLLVAAEGFAVGAGAARRAAEVVGLDRDAARLAADLSPSNRKWLALGRALAGRPRLLMLDEPAAGLDPAERRRLVEVIRAVAAAGAAVLLVDHDLHLVLDVCERLVVLDLGAVVYDGEPDAARDDPRVLTAYLGAGSASDGEQRRPVTAASTSPSPSGETSTEPVVAAVGVSAGYAGTAVVRDLDLHVAAGEVVALLGPNGAGKTTTLLTLAGALPVIDGELRVLGRQPDRRVHRSARRGVAHVLAERRVFGSLTTEDNLRLADRSGRGRREALELFAILRPLLAKPAAALSGGEQQVLAVACALAAEPKLLLVDELSLGLSPAAVDGLLDALVTVSERTGMAILFAEQHARHALRVAQRAYVLTAGRVALEATAEQLSAQPELLARAYLGGDTARR